jgi:subtilisin family serine protease
MYTTTARKERIELTPLPTAVVEDPGTRSLAVRVDATHDADPVTAAALVTRAGRAFFEIGREHGNAPRRRADPAPTPPGPPPLALRENDTSLLRVVYRELVIRFRPGTPAAKEAQILGERGFVVRRRNRFVPVQAVVYDPERRHSGEELIDVANSWAELDEVVFCVPNFVSQFRRHALPAIRSEEWHLRNTGARGGKKGEDVAIRDAWKITAGKPAVVVAVLDDGVDVDHPDLKSRIWHNPKAGPDRIGRDFFLPDDDPDHFNPRPKRFQSPFDQMRGNDIHGTCCAGVAAAAGIRGGAVGAAPHCRILAVKVFHADDLAPDERVADAIRYAALHADVISCSWSGGRGADIETALEDVGHERGGKGVAVFCAAGNEDEPVGYPARDPNAIAVGASTDQAERADYSNHGKTLAFVAPSSGGLRGIFTTDVSLPRRGFNLGTAAAGGADGLYTNDFGGTSSATPLAAGIGALVLSVNPDLTRSELKDVLAANTDKIGAGYDAHGHSNDFGFGRLNAGKAVAAAHASRQAPKKPKPKKPKSKKPKSKKPKSKKRPKPKRGRQSRRR